MMMQEMFQIMVHKILQVIGQYINIVIYLKQIKQLGFMQNTVRRFKEHSKTGVISNWKQFMNYSKKLTFPEGFSDYGENQLEQFWRENFSLLEKEVQKVCYLCKDDLQKDFIQIAIKVIKQFPNLDYQYESLFLGNKKQLIVYSYDQHLIGYLKKYRVPKDYDPTKQKMLRAEEGVDELIFKRNIAISEDVNSLVIDGITSKLQKIRNQEYLPCVEKYKKLLNELMKDFKSQPKKEEMLLASMSDLSIQFIKAICNEHQLYFKHRYSNIGKNQKYIDVVVVKEDPAELQHRNQEQIDELEQTIQAQQQSDIKIQLNRPKYLESVQFVKLENKCALYSVTVPRCGKYNPIEYIIVRNKDETVERIKVQQNKFCYQVKITCNKPGYNLYSFLTENSVGVSQQHEQIKIWFNLDENLDIIMNKVLYLVGSSEEGLIPNPEKEDSTVNSTQDNLQKQFQCVDFSIGSQILLCDQNGVLAGWGKVYSQEDQENSQSTQEDFIKIWSCKTRIQTPSQYSSKDYIRKVSCGLNYSLMVDSFGHAWSFGFNNFGQLGLGHTDRKINTIDPIKIHQFIKMKAFIVDIKASNWGASVALDNEGRVYRWGLNQVEQTNHPIKNSYGDIINYNIHENLNSFQPTPLMLRYLMNKCRKTIIADPIKSIHAGGECFMVVTVKNQVYGWGNIQQLCSDIIYDSKFTVITKICYPIPVMTNINHISLGDHHGIAIKEDGTVFGWGDAKCFIQGSNDKFRKPVKLQVKAGVKRIVCGPNYTVHYNEQKGTAEVIGCRQVFKKGIYEVSQVDKIECGKNVIGFLVKK